MQVHEERESKDKLKRRPVHTQMTPMRRALRIRMGQVHDKVLQTKQR